MTPKKNNYKQTTYPAVAKEDRENLSHHLILSERSVHNSHTREYFLVVYNLMES